MGMMIQEDTAGRIDPTAWEDFDEPPSRWRIAHLDAACAELYRYAGPAFGLLVDADGYAVGVVGCSVRPDAREAVS